MFIPERHISPKSLNKERCPYFTSTIYRQWMGRSCRNISLSFSWVCLSHILFVLLLTTFFKLLDLEHAHAWELRVRNYYRLKYKPFHRKDYTKWGKWCLEVEEKFIAAFANVEYKGAPLCNFTQINIHTSAFHWVSTILFNGTPLQQSTQPWERFHQPIKWYAEYSRGHGMYSSIMRSVCSYIIYTIYNLTSTTI